MTIQEYNIQIFNENRTLAYNNLARETEQVIKNTRVYKNVKRCKTDKHKEPKIRVLNLDTISAVIHYAKNKKVCALNFADALTPGGLVQYGEITQEEAICRCSNLYESLIQPICLEEYYKYNQSYAHVYSDRMIYTNNVSIIRESLHLTLLDKIKKCDILTCPAPFVDASLTYDKYLSIIDNRIKDMLILLTSKNLNVIILGAWGCGAFGGNAFSVGRIFGKYLKEYNNFDEVIFAVPRGNDNYERILEGLQTTNYVRTSIV